MNPGGLFLFALRITHAVAAVIWLGGGVYYAVAIGPLIRSEDPHHRPGAVTARYLFSDWSENAMFVLLGSGMILSFDRLSQGTGGLVYAALLALKVAAAAFAFLLVRRRVRLPKLQLPFGFGTTRTALTLGWLAFLLGVGLARYYGIGLR